MSRERELLIELRTNIINCNITNTVSSIKYWCERIESILAQPEAEPAQDFAQKLADAQKPLPPEFQKVLNDNFWELVTEKPAPAASETPDADDLQRSFDLSKELGSKK